MKIAFTDYSPASAMVRPTFGRDIRGSGIRTMAIWQNLTHYAFVFREFLAPTYRPERHYMRGPGPACARRMGGASVEARVSFR